jgi:hypothetical protein
MEIRERIESCLNDLDDRRRQMAEFESRVRTLMKSLRADGGSPSSMGEVLEVLSDVLHNYARIDSSCREMITALEEIGRNQDNIEQGRRKIVGGVEKILGHLTQMEDLARQSLGDRAPGKREGEAEPLAQEDKPRKKKILLIRLHPQSESAGDDLVRKLEEIERRDPSGGPADAEGSIEELSPDEGPDTVVH